ncbi:MAG: soluble lytic murein transglycosylase [Deltaproteobacteria bacterium]|nr:soluble lytic murein transglycosylase [Deltaproteobacteria bacterium]
MFKILSAVIILILGFSTNGMADIYKFVDKDGVIHFTNVPVDARFKALGWEVEFEHYIGSYEAVIQRMAARYKVEPALIKAVIKAESNFDPSALSRKGAIGLMQLMPATAVNLNVSNPYNPHQNIEGGTKYLRNLTGLFGSDLKLVIAAYNAGENAVIKYGRNIPPYKETRDYVKRVTTYLASYRKEASITNRLARN